MNKKTQIGFYYALIIASIIIIVRFLLIAAYIDIFLGTLGYISFYFLVDAIIYGGLILLYLLWEEPKPKKQAIIIALTLIFLRIYPQLFGYRLYSGDWGYIIIQGVSLAATGLILKSLIDLKKLSIKKLLLSGYIFYYASILITAFLRGILYLFGFIAGDGMDLISNWLNIIPRLLIFSVMILYAVENIKRLGGVKRAGYYVSK